MEEDEYVSLHAGRWSIMCMREAMIPFGRAEQGLPEENASDKGGVFVSVRKGGALRGCIGTIEPVCGEYCGGNHTERSECRHP